MYLAIPNLVVVAEEVEESQEVFMKLDGETPPPPPLAVAQPVGGCGMTISESG